MSDESTDSDRSTDGDQTNSDVHTRVFSEGDALIETNVFRTWLDEDTDDTARFEARVLQDGDWLAFGVGYRAVDDTTDDDSPRVTAGVRPTPQEAREIGHALIDAADAAEAAADESDDEPQSGEGSRLRSVLGSVLS